MNPPARKGCSRRLHRRVAALAFAERVATGDTPQSGAAAPPRPRRRRWGHALGQRERLVEELVRAAGSLRANRDGQFEIVHLGADLRQSGELGEVLPRADGGSGRRRNVGEAGGGQALCEVAQGRCRRKLDAGRKRQAAGVQASQHLVADRGLTQAARDGENHAVPLQQTGDHLVDELMASDDVVRRHGGADGEWIFDRCQSDHLDPQSYSPDARRTPPPIRWFHVARWAVAAAAPPGTSPPRPACCPPAPARRGSRRSAWPGRARDRCRRSRGRAPCRP